MRIGLHMRCNKSSLIAKKLALPRNLSYSSHWQKVTSDHLTTSASVVEWLCVPDVPVTVRLNVPAGVPPPPPEFTLPFEQPAVKHKAASAIVARAIRGRSAKLCRDRGSGRRAAKNVIIIPRLPSIIAATGIQFPGTRGTHSAVARAVDVMEICAVTLLPLGFTDPGATLHTDPAGAPEQVSVTV